MKVTSFVIVDKQTGKAVMETFNRATADAVNRNKFDVLPTLEYLQKLNRDLSMERKSNPTKKFSPAQIAAQNMKSVILSGFLMSVSPSRIVAGRLSVHAASAPANAAIGGGGARRIRMLV